MVEIACLYVYMSVCVYLRERVHVCVYKTPMCISNKELYACVYVSVCLHVSMCVSKEAHYMCVYVLHVCLCVTGLSVAMARVALYNTKAICVIYLSIYLHMYIQTNMYIHIYITILI